MISFFILIWPAILCGVSSGLAIVMQLRPMNTQNPVYWSRVVRWSSLIIGFPFLILYSGFLPFFSSWMDSGYHPFFDVAQNGGLFSLPPVKRYLLASFFPIFLWVGILLAASSKVPEAYSKSLGGDLGYFLDRRWGIGLAVPLIVGLLVALYSIGGGIEAYPGAIWSYGVIMVVSIVGTLASIRSVSRVNSMMVTEAESGAFKSRIDWPEAMQQMGVHVERVVSFSSTQTFSNFGTKQNQINAEAILPQQMRLGLNSLLGLEGEVERDVIIFGPDECGQVEVIAQAAEAIFRRSSSATLVVVPDSKHELANQLRQLLPLPEACSDVDTSVIVPQSYVWIISAAALSQRMREIVREGRYRVGLIVWWALHQYSGVLAANISPLSRRVERLLEDAGGDVLTLAFMRRTRQAGAVDTTFLDRLLPNTFEETSVFSVPALQHRDIEVYLHKSHGEAFPPGSDFSPVDRYPLLVTTFFSLKAGWLSTLRLGFSTAGNSWKVIKGLLSAEEKAILRSSPNLAEVSHLDLDENDVLELPDIIGQGSRLLCSGEPPTPHYVVLMSPLNPYVEYILSIMNADIDSLPPRHRVRLSSNEVDMRHIRLALSEREDTGVELSRRFNYQDELIDSMLKSLESRDKLQFEEVRFLDKTGTADRKTIVRDQRYRSREAEGPLERRPLEVLSDDAVRIVSIDDAHAPPKLLVDKERLTVLAYPGRVFWSDENRYRINNWVDADEVIARGRIGCVRINDEHVRTMRISRGTISGLRQVEATRQTADLMTSIIELEYYSTLYGVLSITQDPKKGSLTPRRTISQEVIDSPSFRTKALLLEAPFVEKKVNCIPGLASLAFALKHVLPVHLAIEESAVDVVVVNDDVRQGTDRRRAVGLAFVDAYPGSLGVGEALGGAVLHELLISTYRWLETCACDDTYGCPKCLQSIRRLTEERAMGRTDALRVLASLLGDSSQASS